MQDERRAVLERVARGEITPTEAASLLEELDTRSQEPAAEEDDPRDWAKDWEQPPGGSESAPPPPPETGTGAAARIRVVCTIGTADIIGDPSVREAVADGPHLARREGDMLIIRGQELGQDMGPGFMFGWDEGRWGDRHERHRQRMMRVRRHGQHGNAPLRVRVNPDLPLDVENQAGRLRIRGVHGPIRATVQAGGTDIDDFRSPFDLTVQAGSVRARGRLDAGASHVRCEAGGVRIHLERGSSVKVNTRTTLGKVHLPGDGRSSSVTIGGGAGTLDIDATMGAVRVSADD